MTMPTPTEETTALRGSQPEPPLAPVAIEVRGVKKAFRLPVSKITSLKEQVTTFARPDYRQLKALDGVSFDVHRGEFFGIVGRNGSGKSTLLKVLASIYGADAGTVRMAGRLAPFIELGVGFNPELTARENVELNGVMMGLERREARSRLGAVLEFAELEEFVDMKLKNYSSGMLVRLAFSVMIQSDAEILLIDEVLAVGDAAFQQKCADVFHEMRDSDRTVILVTHDMGAVEHYCHRAMLLHDGELKAVGDPGDVARSYLRLNFQSAPTSGEDSLGEVADVVIEDAWLEDDEGGRVTTLEKGAELRFRASLEARRDVEGPTFGFVLTNVDGVDVVGFGVPPEQLPERLAAGQRLEISAALENRLAPGRYIVKSWIHRNRNIANLVLFSPHVLDFVVFGMGEPGVTYFDQEVRLELEGGGR
jgi:ABC-type polysaccharide/polyol phosphate transport system ATPase subunit